MAYRMTRRAHWMVLAAFAWLAPAHAQPQQAGIDPTRPPASAGFQEAAEEGAPGKQLQSILISGGRRVAVISGTMVPLGGMLGDARVVKISETEVVLKTGEETETLKLYPSVDKQPAARAGRRSRTDASAQGSSSRGGSK